MEEPSPSAQVFDRALSRLVDQRPASSMWRVQDDAVDFVLQRFEDRVLRGNTPTCPEAWLKTVLTNAARKGPEQRELSLTQVVSLEALTEPGRCAPAYARVHPAASSLREQLKRVDARLIRKLSKMERAVFKQAPRCESVLELSRAVGTSPRAVRTYLERIACKARLLLHKPPPKSAPRPG